MDFAALNAYERIHLIEHLCIAGLSSDAHKILDDFDAANFSWAKFRLDIEQSNAGYLSDLDAARRMLASTANNWPRLLGYALCAGSVIGQMIGPSAKLACDLYAGGVVSAHESIEATRRTVDPDAAVRLLIMLAQSSAQGGRAGENLAFCREALVRIEYLDEPMAQALLFREILRVLPDASVELAALTAQKFTHLGWQSMCFSHLARRCSPGLRLRVLSYALDTALTAKGVVFKSLALAAVGRELNRRDLLDQAVALAQTDDDLHLRCRLLASVALYLPAASLESSWHYISELPAWQRDTTGRWLAREHALHGYVPALASAGLYERMFEAIGLMDELNWYAQSLVSVASAAVDTPKRVTRRLIELVIAQLASDFREELAQVLKVGGATLDGKRFAAAVQDAFGLEPIDSWKYPFQMDNHRFAPARAATVLAMDMSVGRTRKLIEIVRTSAAYSDAEKITAIALLHQKVGDHSQAYAAIEAIEDASERSSGYCALARFAPLVDRSALARAALALAEQIGDDRVRIARMIDCFAFLDAGTRGVKLAQLNRESLEIGDSKSRDAFLASMQNPDAALPSRSLPLGAAPTVLKRDLPARPLSEDFRIALQERIKRIPSLSMVGIYDEPTERDTAISDLFDELIEYSMFDEAAQVGSMAVSFAFGQPSEYFVKLVEAGGYVAALDHSASLNALDKLAETISSFPTCFYPKLVEIIQRSPQSQNAQAVIAMCTEDLSGEIIGSLLPSIFSLSNDKILVQCLSSLSRSWLSWHDHEPSSASKALQEMVWNLSKRPRPVVLDALTGLAPLLLRIAGAGLAEQLQPALNRCAKAWP